jgi:hypothetical protein
VRWWTRPFPGVPRTQAANGFRPMMELNSRDRQLCLRHHPASQEERHRKSPNRRAVRNSFSRLSPVGRVDPNEGMSCYTGPAKIPPEGGFGKISGVFPKREQNLSGMGKSQRCGGPGRDVWAPGTQDAIKSWATMELGFCNRCIWRCGQPPIWVSRVYFDKGGVDNPTWGCRQGNGVVATLPGTFVMLDPWVPM